MGSAYVAMGGDTYSSYYNPAGLSQIKGFEAAFQRTHWIADITYNYASMAFPIYRSVIVGAQVISLTMADMEVRTEFDQEGTGEMFSAGDILLGLSFATRISDRFSMGGTAKYVREHIWHMIADAMAFDVGTRYVAPFLNMVIGVSITNFGESLRLEGRDVNIKYDPAPTFAGNNDKVPAEYTLDKYSMPLTFRLGIANDLLPEHSGMLKLAVEAVHPYSTDEYINWGMEFKPVSILAIRVGYKSMFQPGSEEGLTLGGGLKLELSGFGNLDIDYAYTDFGRFDAVTLYSIGLSFP